MPWHGMLRKANLSQLDEEFGKVVICPGFCSEFGKVCDDWGRVFIPGAALGYSATRKRLLIWQRKIADDERYNWWPEEAKEAGVNTLTVSRIKRLTCHRIYLHICSPPAYRIGEALLVLQVSDALAGIQKTAWDQHRAQYRIIRQKKTRRRMVEEAREEMRTITSEEQHPQEAALVLTGLVSH